jgi:hypothetical protein
MAVTPEADPAAMPAATARRFAAAVERLLSAWGDFPPAVRQRLVARAIADIPRPVNDARQAARQAMTVLVARWSASLATALAPIPSEELRAAFLAIDGARRWPEQFLDSSASPAFRDALRRALPRPLPAETPLEMPRQPLSR